MADNADTNQPTGTPETTTETAFDFAAWLAGQDEAVKTGLTKHFETEAAGLKSALTKERETRDALDKQLKTLSKNADKGSDLEKQLAELSAQLAASKQRIAFFATKPADLADDEAAWLLADSKGLIGEDGTVKWDALKTQHPALFAAKQEAQKPPPPNTNAANGGRATGVTQQDLIAQKRKSGLYSSI
jgi:uncharacterized protein (DUF3084 family)